MYVDKFYNNFIYAPSLFRYKHNFDLRFFTIHIQLKICIKYEIYQCNFKVIKIENIVKNILLQYITFYQNVGCHLLKEIQNFSIKFSSVDWENPWFNPHSSLLLIKKKREVIHTFFIYIITSYSRVLICKAYKIFYLE